MSDDDIHIVDYDPRWPSRVAEEAERVRRLIAALSLEIEHHGSTAVPGLAVKPVIDMLVGVNWSAEDRVDLGEVRRYLT